MRITSAGLVGIGTDTPLTALHITQANDPVITLEDTDFGASATLKGSNGNMRVGSTSATHFDVAGSEKMRVSAAGNLGIGTTNPSTNIGFGIGNDIRISQVADTAHQAGNAGSVGLAISDGGGFSGVFVNNTHDGTYSDQLITFKTAEGGISPATERLRIDATGNVGIGTTSPDSLLHVDGAIQAKSSIETYQALTGTSVSIDCSAASVFSLSTTGTTTFSFTNVPSISNTALGLTLEVTAGGTHTLNWPASVKWAGGTAPDAPASGETNIYGFYTRNAGTTWYGFLSGAAMA